MVQDVEPVPFPAATVATFGDLARHRQHARTIGSRERSLSEYEHRMVRVAQPSKPRMVAVPQRIQRLATLAQHLDRKRQIEGRADRGHWKPPLEIAFAQPCVEEWCLPTRVGADEQTSV